MLKKIFTLTITLTLLTYSQAFGAINIHDPSLPKKSDMIDCYKFSTYKIISKTIKKAVEIKGNVLSGEEGYIKANGGKSCLFGNRSIESATRISILKNSKKVFYSKVPGWEKSGYKKLSNSYLIYYIKELNMTGEGHTFGYEAFNGTCWLSVRSTYIYANSRAALSLIEAGFKDCDLLY